MLSIDEAIDFCNGKSKNIKLRTEPKTFEQIAEWLEELKADRIALEKANGYLEANYRLGYNKAIDDFINACKEDILCQTFGLHQKNIERITEQLKAGGVNDNRY